MAASSMRAMAQHDAGSAARAIDGAMLHASMLGAARPQDGAHDVGAADPHAVARALADLVGTEPGPRDVRAAYRTPVPGLGPLDRLERVVREQVATLAAHGVPPESIVLHLRRIVRDCLPSHTADWSAHLLTEAVVRWSIGEGGAAQ